MTRPRRRLTDEVDGDGDGDDSEDGDDERDDSAARTRDARERHLVRVRLKRPTHRSDPAYDRMYGWSGFIGS